ncbi:hypothetical protein PCANC_19229 [Puccinia coronata f. sp. avenae]|uniref:Uncharacterized protein n=1 Tax=Puccinia coronata f. sp. avenae TaxID=200324 RepID=A0A2N5U9W4_9BASI|nr:hypothetical protein PCANC_19229 [Puccinia coronata f. sp. avenae]
MQYNPSTSSLRCCPSLVHLNNSYGQLDSYGTEARLRFAQRELGISDTTYNKFKVLFKLKPEEQLPIIALMIHDHHSSPTTVAAGAQAAIPEISTPKSAKNHAYPSDFKILSSMAVPYLAAGILAKIQFSKYCQGKPFWHANLPAGYNKKESEALKSVISEIRKTVKNEKGYFPKLLMKGIRNDTNPKKPPTVAVPSIISLAAQVHRMMDKKYLPMNNKEVTQSFNDSTPLAVRISFLRNHLFHQLSKGDSETNWEAIDDHLEEVRKKPPLHQKAFAELLLEMDLRVWDGKTMVDAVSPDFTEWPTEPQIASQVASYTTNQISIPNDQSPSPP